MRERPTDSDYLKKEDATSWPSCKLQDPYVGTSDYGDTNYLYMGKDYTAPTYFIAQTFMRFPTNQIRNSHEIESATLRLYIAEDGSDTDFTLWLIVPDTSYGTVDPTDWIVTFTTYTTIVVSDNTIKTDKYGDYIDIPFNAAMLAKLAKTAGSTIELALKANEVAEPTNGQFLKCYSHQYATETLRPRLTVVTKGIRQQILEGLRDTLDTIDEFDGYATTPETVSITYRGFPAVDQTKCPAIYVLTDDENRARTSYQVDDVDWHPHLLAMVFNPDGAVLAQRLNELIDDIEYCLGRNPELSLSGGIQLARIQSLDTSDSLVIDDNYAMALIRLEILYATHVNEP